MVADITRDADRTLAAGLNEINRDVVIEQARLTYQQERARISEAQNEVRLKMQDHHTNTARKLQAYTSYDELHIRAQYGYYDALIRRALQYIPVGIEFALKAASGPDQITFENWLRMAKILGDAQLQISGLIGDMFPGGSLT
jgi:hypothetical protein